MYCGEQRRLMTSPKGTHTVVGRAKEPKVVEKEVR